MRRASRARSIEACQTAHRLRVTTPASRVAAPLLGLAVAACAPSRCPEVAPAAATPAVAPAIPPVAPVTPPAAGPRLSITVRPTPSKSAVEVEVVATVGAGADADALTRFSITPDGGLASLHLGEVRDAQGPMATTPVVGADGRVTITLPRPPTGELRLAYTVDGKLRANFAMPGVDVDPNRFQATGEPLLLLPDGLDDRAVHASITLDTTAYEAETGHRTFVDGASSFGAGKQREVDVRGGELRRGYYAVGGLGRALFDAPEGRDEAVWIGYTSFDPRPIAADVAAFRTAVRELFKGGDELPLTLLIVSDARPVGAFAAARRARSVVARVGAGEAWSGPVRIAVAVEVIHGWMGSRLWVGPDDALHEAEAYWFTEGVTRWLARDLLFRFGLITPAEMLAEVHGLMGLAATSPRAPESNAALAAHAKESQAVPLLVARGALYATRVNALIRARSKGARGLADVLRGLFQKAQDKRGPLPDAAWIEAVGAELGAGEAAAFARNIGEGRLSDPPDTALGPCFRRAARTYEAYDLGFDEDRTRADTSRVIAGLRPGGPAEKAGVRAGDVLIDAIVGRGRSDVKVTIHVKRGAEVKTFAYFPKGAQARGQGFVRKPDVAEEACTR